MRDTSPVLWRGVAFITGVGVTTLPSVGPFLAIFSVLSGQLTLQRADLWWWAASALLALPYALTGHLLPALLTAGQVVAAWLIFRSAAELRRNSRSASLPRAMSLGAVVGLGITLALGLTQIGELRLETARTALDAIVWNTHPTIFGHAFLVLSALVALITPFPALRVLALALGAAGVIASGAREAVWAWLLIATALALLNGRAEKPSTANRIAHWALVGMMALLVSGLSASLGLGRTGFLTDFAAEPDNPNLFRGTEVAAGDWWHPLGVSFKARPVTIDGEERTAFEATKTSPDQWSRLQQVVTLLPGETYTLSALIREGSGTTPGFDGWGRGGDERTVNLGTRLDGLAHQASTTGALQLVSVGAAPAHNGWIRAHATFTFEGQAPLTWYVGLVPDRSPRTGTATTFAELQLTPTGSPLPYRAGNAARGVTDVRTSRFPIWRDALSAAAARPLLGWGPGGLPLAVGELHPDELSVRPVAAHAHNAFLAVLVDRGLVGLLGLIGLLALLALRAVQQRDRAASWVLVGVLILNLFDATLLSGAVIYPLAAALGWRAASSRRAAEAETGVGSAALVRLGLALGDAAAGATALTLGLLAASGQLQLQTAMGEFGAPLLYITMLWPAAAAAAGLYPGYGLPSHMQLARSVGAALTAGLLAAFMMLVIPNLISLPPAALLVAVTAGALLAPLYRMLAVLALRRLRLWGRPVALLGTSSDMQDVARHLLKNPETGLMPLVAFGSPTEWASADPALGGDLHAAFARMQELGIRHAVISPEAARVVAFDDVLLQESGQLKHVQYLPDLRGLPANSVTATPLGANLALEVRVQLAYSANRAIKRAADLLGAAAITALLLAPMLLIALLISLDSRGWPLHLSPRLGRHGRLFRCVKFRTMVPNADQYLERVLAEDPALRAEYAKYHKLEHDPRITRIGRLLRKLSLDELPQLLNVIIGQMSLVGPRPYLVDELDLMSSEKNLIFLARPGMTGYWQVEARNDVTFQERQKMEAHYVRNWSVWWDIDILLRTPSAMLRKTGK